MRRSRARKWLALLPAAAAGALLIAAPAHATPGKSPQWTLVLVGTCDGVPATLIDPPGPGPTAFNTLTGKMGVGRLYQWIAPDGTLAQEDEYGIALEHANQSIATCDFPIPPEFSPDGSSGWTFRVTGFFR